MIFLKILKSISKKYNILIEEIFVFNALGIANSDFDLIFSKIDIDFNKKDKDFLKEFFNYLKESDYRKFSEQFVEYIDDFNESANILALFFLNFVNSIDNKKEMIEDLKKYNKDIADAIIKSLEMLSAVKLLNEKDKRDIIKEVIYTILVLSKIFSLKEDI